jgi:hypothetical protein
MIQDWILVSEQLPKIDREPEESYTSDVGKRCIVCDDDGYVYEATYWKVSKQFQDNGVLCKPLYWMHYPEAPKELTKKG